MGTNHSSPNLPQPLSLGLLPAAPTASQGQDSVGPLPAWFPSHSPSSSLQLIPEALSSAPIRPLCCPPQAKPSFTKHWCRALTLFKTSVATSPLLDSCYSHEFAISVAIYLYSLTKSLQFYGSSSHRPSPVKHLVSYLMINPLPTIPSDHLLISKVRLNWTWTQRPFPSASAKRVLYFYIPYKSYLCQQGFQSTALGEELCTPQATTAEYHATPVLLWTHSDNLILICSISKWTLTNS